MSDFFGCEINCLSYKEVPSIVDRVAACLAILKPKPSPYALVRVGKKRDGSYLLPDDFTGISDCFSPGVNGTKHFEDDLALSFGIRSHMIDASCSVSDFKTPLIKGLQDFRPLWLDSFSTGDSVSLSSWIEEVNPPLEQDLILQMDIEGAEYRCILATPDDILTRFRIIAIELHEVPLALQDPQYLLSVMEPFLRKLDKYFVCIHVHPNNCYRDVLMTAPRIRVPRLLELTFLRRDRLSLKQDERCHPIALPHSQDIVNMPDYPPLFLDSFWVSDKTQLSTEIRKMWLWIRYLRARLARVAKRMSRVPLE